jgi:predicted ATP-dependent serine protease
MIHCNHCQLKRKCYKGSVKDCDKYNAIANEPSQLTEQIREAFKNKDYDKAKQLQEELFRLNHG